MEFGTNFVGDMYIWNWTLEQSVGVNYKPDYPCVFGLLTLL